MSAAQASELRDERKTRPILFAAESIHGIRKGTKTQTRRLMTPQPHWQEGQHPGWRWPWPAGRSMIEPREAGGLGPHGGKGDFLWVKEAIGAPVGDDILQLKEYEGGHNTARIVYRADAHHLTNIQWVSPIFMPRWASRLTLQITSARVERLNQITEEDALREGCQPTDASLVFASEDEHDQEAKALANTARGAYACAWDRLNGKRAPWLSNPWVRVFDFKVVSGEKS